MKILGNDNGRFFVTKNFRTEFWSLVRPIGKGKAITVGLAFLELAKTHKVDVKDLSNGFCNTYNKHADFSLEILNAISGCWFSDESYTWEEALKAMSRVGLRKIAERIADEAAAAVKAEADRVAKIKEAEHAEWLSLQKRVHAAEELVRKQRTEELNVLHARLQKLDSHLDYSMDDSDELVCFDSNDIPALGHQVCFMIPPTPSFAGLSLGLFRRR